MMHQAAIKTFLAPRHPPSPNTTRPSCSCLSLRAIRRLHGSVIKSIPPRLCRHCLHTSLFFPPVAADLYVQFARELAGGREKKSGTQTLRDGASASIFISTVKNKARLHKAPADRSAPIGRARIRFSPVSE